MAANLQRFVDAQRPVYERALAEMRAGRKTSHWMWFVFPQIEGLGQSAMSRHYAITSLDEARAYLDHPLLGARLHESLETLAMLPTRDAEEIFGSIDAVKLRSSLTLFAEAAPDDPIFSAGLAQWFGGKRDLATLDQLRNFAIAARKNS